MSQVIDGPEYTLHSRIAEYNWPWWIRTTINGSKVRCPAVGRRAKNTLKPSNHREAAKGIEQRHG
jgi:hypothetical protein